MQSGSNTIYRKLKQEVKGLGLDSMQVIIAAREDVNRLILTG